jgi:pimeloyl-ACP methyl ester carboxylesterase
MPLVGSVLGSIVNAVLVRGLVAIERVWPMPHRLGVPLASGMRAGADADPVVLVGGFANSPSGWDEWRRSLEADGFHVFVFDAPTVGLGDMEAAAREVAAFIAEVRRRTGRARVDVIGFSEGGLLARMAVRRYGALGSVDRLVGLATPTRGVRARWIYDLLKGVRSLVEATPPAALQLLEGSALLASVEQEDRALRSGGDPHAPRYAAVFSRVMDPVVSPLTSWLQGADNVPVGADRPGRLGPNHFEMLHTSDHAYEAVRVLLCDGGADAARRAGLGQG